MSPQNFVSLSACDTILVSATRGLLFPNPSDTDSLVSSQSYELPGSFFRTPLPCVPLLVMLLIPTFAL